MFTILFIYFNFIYFYLFSVGMGGDCSQESHYKIKSSVFIRFICHCL